MQSLDYKNAERKEFWDALMVVAEAELKEARKQDEVDRARLRGMREPDQDAREDRGVQAAVDMDVQIFLTGQARSISLPATYKQAAHACCMEPAQHARSGLQPTGLTYCRQGILGVFMCSSLGISDVCTAAWYQFA